MAVVNQAGRRRWSRQLLLTLVVGTSLIAAACGAQAPSTAPGSGGTGDGTGTTKTSLVLGTDINDTRTLDPHRQFDTSPYLSMKGAYENLVTIDPSDYSKLLPQLATSWERSEDGKGWVFTLRDGVKFASGNPFTAEDVAFSYMRLKNLKDGPSAYAENIDSVEVIDPLTVKVNLVDPNIPFVTLTLISGTYGIVDSKLIKEQGGSAEADADQTDTATAYFDEQSAGTGPYQITSWERGAQIVLERNPNWWGGTTPFERVVIRGFADTSAEVLALERGDIDLAMNLNSDQIDTLVGKPGITISEAPSLDMLYWTLSEKHAESGPLADARVREAVFSSIDYDGIINGLLGGHALRPAGFMVIGLGGQDEAFAEENRYQYDTARAQQLLADAGYADGFSFELSYPTFVFAGVPYDQLAAKIQSDLAKVGITANLNPMDRTTFTTAFRAGEIVSGLTDWVADGPEAWTFAEPSVMRVAVRANWTPSDALIAQMNDAAGESDPAAQAEKYRAFTKEVIKQHAYSLLFQPVYRYASTDAIKDLKFTAAGWFVHMDEIKPAE
jgi:peptide/nickel transport system substrate-binding protein